MEPSRSGDPHDNLIPWQIIKGKEWSHQEIGHAGPPSQRRVGRDAVGYYHERKNEYRNVVLGRIMSGLTCVADQLPVPRAVGAPALRLSGPIFYDFAPIAS